MKCPTLHLLKDLIYQYLLLFVSKETNAGDTFKVTGYVK